MLSEEIQPQYPNFLFCKFGGEYCAWNGCLFQLYELDMIRRNPHLNEEEILSLIENVWYIAAIQGCKLG